MSKYQRIDDIKSQFKDKAKRFYLFDKVSDHSAVGDKAWKDIKDSVCSGDYKNESWYSRSVGTEIEACWTDMIWGTSG